MTLGTGALRHRRLASAAARLPPAEWAALGISLVVVGTLAVRQLGGAHLGAEIRLHVAILVAFVALVVAARHFSGFGWVERTRPLLALAVMFTLYFTLARVAFVAIPWRADATLAALDRTLFFGVQPSLWLDRQLTPAAVEAASLAYGLFIPYLYLSLVVGLLGRPPAERDELVTSLALLYALAFLGYLFAPARGPIVELADRFATPLPGGPFHALVVDAVARSGGPHGALPSLHVGVSLLACSFDLRFNRLRGLVYLPLLLGILVGTVVLRYHWVIDLPAGALLAALAAYAAPRLLARMGGGSP